MNSTIFFTERQRFNKPWHYLLLFSINGLILFAVIQQVLYGNISGNHALSTAGLLIVAAIGCLCSLLVFVVLKMDTQITNEGIQVRFYPFNLKFRLYSWKDVSQVFVRKYNPISEYGGWGIRIGFSGKIKAFNISGNKGIQLIFNNGSRLLIGTQKENDAKLALEKISLA